jgi:bifunctional DNA-binding transcriptional regulator/antitoxin component of YhaV-PrlF toxin-antitoxin module
MREIVKIRAGSNGEISVAIPKDIRAVVPLKAGDKVLMTARGGQIIIEAESPNPFRNNKRKK